MHSDIINLGQGDFTLCPLLWNSPATGGPVVPPKVIPYSHCVSLLVSLNATGRYLMLVYRVCKAILKVCKKPSIASRLSRTGEVRSGEVPRREYG